MSNPNIKKDFINEINNISNIKDIALFDFKYDDLIKSLKNEKIKNKIVEIFTWKIENLDKKIEKIT